MTISIIRELQEETGLNATVDRFLFSEPFEHGLCDCYLLLAKESSEPVLGTDPEEDHLPVEHRMLRRTAWKTVEEMCDDRQVSQVLRAIARLPNE
jgi:8-oxo-dGTP pyrophosphatase MutT (NUDIX family)